MSAFRRQILVVTLLALIGAPALQAATLVQQMGLQDMCDRAGNIVRGTVIELSPGSITAGGGELPTVTYRIKVDEDFLGNVPEEKGVRILEVTMIGNLKATNPGPNTRHFSALPDLPQLNVGSEYLLLTTPPSSAGLSTTVGLGQGCFSISHSDKAEMAANELNNSGLFDGPVAYSELANLIRNAVAQ